MTQLHFDTDIPFVWTAQFHWLGYMLFIALLPDPMIHAVYMFLFYLALLLLAVSQRPADPPATH